LLKIPRISFQKLGGAHAILATILPNKGPAENNQAKSIAARHHAEAGASASARLARDLFGGCYSADQRLDLCAVAAEYDIDLELVLKTFDENGKR
jgi:hypothetical protein